MSAEVPLPLVAHRDYARVVRPELPAVAFRPDPRKLAGIAVHLAVVVAGILAVRAVDAVWARALLSLVIGHGLAGLAFFGHELSHGAIVRRGGPRYLLELVCWSPRLMPVTAWRRLHNAQHHAHSNTPRDCDRQPMGRELALPVRVLGRAMTPFGNPVRWNPLVGLAFFWYTVYNVALAFLTGGRPGPAGPFRVPYRRGERRRVAAELGVIAAGQLGVFALAGCDPWAYLWCGPVPIAVSSAVTMAYIFTNHFLNPVTEQADPVLGTTSVAVPRLVDRLHAHFSYHTEHHLFPNLNSDYYPLVGRILAREFPGRYTRIPLWEAWRRLWAVPLGGRLVPAVRVPLAAVREPGPPG